MSWWSKKKNNTSGTYSKISGSNGKRTNGFGKTEEIPKMVLEGLNSQNEGTVLMRIRSLGAENNYPKTDVCERLILLIQRDGRGKVVEEASSALVNVLKNMMNTDTVILLIKQGLFAKNEKNAEFFVKMLDEPGCRVPLKKCAAEMMAGFTEKDVNPETMDRMEAVLFERHDDPKENNEIKNLIKYRFGSNRDGRPKIMVDEEREDETRAISDPPVGIHAGPTQALDVISGWTEKLGSPNEKEGKFAADILADIAERSADRKTVERIMNSLGEHGAAFVSQYRKIRSKLQSMTFTADDRKRITGPPGPNQSRKPTGKVKVLTPKKI